MDKFSPVIRNVRRHLLLLLALLLLSAAGTGFSLWMPRLQGGFVDALRTSDWNIARHYIVWLIVVLAGSLLLGYLQLALGLNGNRFYANEVIEKEAGSIFKVYGRRAAAFR